jgi:hypothetical protein
VVIPAIDDCQYCNRELTNCPEGEIQEMIDLYTARGVSEEDARKAIELLSRYEVCYFSPPPFSFFSFPFVHHRQQIPLTTFLCV